MPVVSKSAQCGPAVRRAGCGKTKHAIWEMGAEGYGLLCGIYRCRPADLPYSVLAEGAQGGRGREFSQLLHGFALAKRPAKAYNNRTGWERHPWPETDWKGSGMRRDRRSHRSKLYIPGAAHPLSGIMPATRAPADPCLFGAKKSGTARAFFALLPVSGKA